MKLTAEQKDSRTRIVSLTKNMVQITVSQEAAQEMVDFIDEETVDVPDDTPGSLDGVDTVYKALQNGLKQLKNNRKAG